MVEINYCNSSPCQNGAICNRRLNGYTCSCQPGFSGVHCQNSKLHVIFSFIPYYNRKLQSFEKILYQIVNLWIKRTFYISFVEIKWKKCLFVVEEVSFTCPDKRLLCKNFSLILAMIAVIYSFHCFLRVKTDIDECASWPCVHGTCADHINGCTCRCVPGHTGLHCQLGNGQLFICLQTFQSYLT